MSVSTKAVRTSVITGIIAAAGVLGGGSTTQAAVINSFWAFQAATNTTSTTNVDLGTTPTFSPNVETWTGTPTINAVSGTILKSFSGSGASFTDFQGTSWSDGRHVGWDSNAAGNSFTLNLSMTDTSDLNVRLGYRSTTGTPTVVAFSAVDYSVNGGAFASVGSFSGLTADSTWRAWTLDLSDLSAIENQTAVALRWTLPTIPAAKSFRLDNLQISGTMEAVPEPSSLALAGLGALGVLRRRRR